MTTLTDDATAIARLDAARAEVARTHQESMAALDELAAALDAAYPELPEPPAAGPKGVWPSLVSEIPVDGSVEIRTVDTGQHGRFGPWGHVIGELLRAVGGGENRSFLIGGVVEPWTFHRDQGVQVRRRVVPDVRLAEARYELENGGL